MKKKFSPTLPQHFQDVLTALQKLPENNEAYRLIKAEGHTVTLETGGFTTKEWATSTKATVEPKRTIVVTVTPSPYNHAMLSVEITRMGLFDLFGLIKKDYEQFIAALETVL